MWFGIAGGHDLERKRAFKQEAGIVQAGNPWPLKREKRVNGFIIPHLEKVDFNIISVRN